MSCECACHRLGVESIEADCRCGRWETNGYSVIGEVATLVDEIAVWNPEAVINLKRPAGPASP